MPHGGLCCNQPVEELSAEQLAHDPPIAKLPAASTGTNRTAAEAQLPAQSNDISSAAQPGQSWPVLRDLLPPVLWRWCPPRSSPNMLLRVAAAEEPAWSIAVARLGPNGLKFEKESTHDLLSRRRFMKMA